MSNYLQQDVETKRGPQKERPPVAIQKLKKTIIQKYLSFQWSCHGNWTSKNKKNCKTSCNEISEEPIGSTHQQHLRKTVTHHFFLDQLFHIITRFKPKEKIQFVPFYSLLAFLFVDLDLTCNFYNCSFKNGCWIYFRKDVYDKQQSNG